MKRYPANTQLKLIFFIALLALAGYYLQTNYNLFNAQPLIEKKQEEVSDDFVDITKVYVINSKAEKLEVNVELADTDSKRSKGLMGRESLGQNSGMLFIFDQTSISGFWMKNVKIDLDMIFADENGAIVYIEHSAKPCTEDPCTVYNSNRAYNYVLEVNGGWATENSVAVGDSLDLRTVQSDSLGN